MKTPTGLLYKTGAIDEALLVMKDAIDIDDRDPDSNFFIANLYSAKVRKLVNHVFGGRRGGRQIT